ncbi:PASTA domain-containing protein [Mycobacterium sp. CVI_P3]|uniref:PASTA domain-containing protein n=1 Tax=Mycobacterium pinniadriaticum TaxID=2994102 RepID=A0ABT3SF51_9MYCO|nr:PASTA domain-containing protein [Mycobacterium pinniadriaticum]MCX2931344.1 PASTA domain-containing protein [Mycobacterium pinniadriaticum]MCX2937768.1 PASTA domain-containing protein [Mycobacterium pinniadriaticum]
MEMRGKLTIAAISLSCIALSACGATTTPAQTVTVTSTTATPVYTASATTHAPLTPVPVDTPDAAPAGITIPDVTGQNAEIARARLEGLGLTNVELASANPKYSMVILAKNWTVVSIEPAPGTTVDAGSPVIVKVYKD